MWDYRIRDWWREPLFCLGCKTFPNLPLFGLALFGRRNNPWFNICNSVGTTHDREATKQIPWTTRPWWVVRFWQMYQQNNVNWSDEWRVMQRHLPQISLKPKNFVKSPVESRTIVQHENRQWIFLDTLGRFLCESSQGRYYTWCDKECGYVIFSYWSNIIWRLWHIWTVRWPFFRLPNLKGNWTSHQISLIVSHYKNDMPGMQSGSESREQFWGYMNPRAYLDRGSNGTMRGLKILTTKQSRSTFHWPLL